MTTAQTPGPWRVVRVDGGYHTHHIETDAGHVASIVGWTYPGNTCTTTEANARLIEHAPDMAAALAELLAWAGLMGGWDGPCWRRAQAVLKHATDDNPIPAPVQPKSIDEVIAPISSDEGWNEQTERTLLIRFLDELAVNDPTIPVRLEAHLRDATDL